jgi:O-antigen/teichoic acid export membrane protein
VAGAPDADLLRRRLLTGGAWALGGKFFAGVNLLAANYLLARLLSPAQLGSYFLVFNGVVIAAVVAQLGMGQTVVRLVAQAMGTGREADVPGTLNRAAAFTLFGSTVIAAAVGLALVLGSADAPAALVRVASLGVIWVAMVALQGLVAETFRGLHNLRGTVLYGGITAGVLSPMLATAAYTVLWLGPGHSDLRTVVALGVAAGGLALAAAGGSLRRRLRELAVAGRKPGPRGLFRTAWPVWIAQVSGALMLYADVWVLGLFRLPQEVAVYGGAVRLATLVVLPFVIINAATAPIIAELYTQGHRARLQRVLQGLAAIAMVPAAAVALVFTFGGGEVMALVFGDYYRAGAVALSVLSIGQLVNVASGPCALTLMMTGHQHAMMRMILVTGVLILTASVWAAIHYGVLGVAVAVAGGMAVQNVGLWLIARRVVGIWTHAAPAQAWGALVRLWMLIR